jgi:hypothetical protein
MPPMTSQQQHEWNLESFRSMAETGKAAQTALLTVVGGSAAALLSFVGVLAGNPARQALVVELMGAMGWLAGSLLAILLMSGFAYLAQGGYKVATFERSDALTTDDLSKKKALNKRAHHFERYADVVAACVAAFFAAAVALWIVGAWHAISAGQEAARQSPSSASADHR